LIPESVNPNYIEKIPADFFFEESHRFLIEIYDADDGTQLNNLSK